MARGDKGKEREDNVAKKVVRSQLWKEVVEEAKQGPWKKRLVRRLDARGNIHPDQSHQRPTSPRYMEKVGRRW